VSEPLAGSESNLYLSPEILPSVGTVHLWSAARALDLPSDVWALGCLVARLATLKPLYYKERPALYEALSLATADERAAAARECIATGMWRPAAQLEGEAFLPLGLLELVQKCTSLKPAERPSSALVHSALEQLREEEEAEGASDGLELPVPVHPLAQAYVTAASGSSLPDVSLPEQARAEAEAARAEAEAARAEAEAARAEAEEAAKAFAEAEEAHEAETARREEEPLIREKEHSAEVATLKAQLRVATEAATEANSTSRAMTNVSSFMSQVMTARFPTDAPATEPANQKVEAPGAIPEDNLTV
jgi:hypothetical protein